MYYALHHMEISKARYAREVLVPGYLPILAWTLPVVALANALNPSGLIGLGLFCGVALAALWLALLPTLRVRWQRMLVDDRLSAAVPA